MDTLQDRITDLLCDLKPETDFSKSTDFIADYLLDSFDVIALCDLIEEHLGVTIDLDDIEPAHFTGIDAIASLVKKSGFSA